METAGKSNYVFWMCYHIQLLARTRPQETIRYHQNASSLCQVSDGDDKGEGATDKVLVITTARWFTVAQLSRWEAKAHKSLSVS